MGYGSWNSCSYDAYTKSTRGMSATAYSTSMLNEQQIFTSRHLDPELNPKNIMRECCDSDEHPNTLPVILALDVTGSMGSAAATVAKKLGEIMNDIFADKQVPDIEFCIMAIGDLAYDNAPIQMSQYESDTRIAEQLDKVYFEHGGGGNSFESYTGAWYMGARHSKLDCWKRGQKGIIITLGDEQLNPYLPQSNLMRATRDSLQGDIETADLYKEASEKFNLYHISIDDSHNCYDYNNRQHAVDNSFTKVIGKDNYRVSTIDALPGTIVDIILKESAGGSSKAHKTLIATSTDEGIYW